MNEYLDYLDNLLVHHQLLRVLVIYVLQFDFVYHEVPGEKLEQLELDLMTKKEKYKKYSKRFLSIL